MESRDSSSGEKQGFPSLPSSSLPDSSAGENTDVPKPLGALQEIPVPPFLTKTYELVEDPTLDPTVSWGLNGESFVVWDPVDFARTILPRHFKHNNFSSFVRQLNTYISSCFAAVGISVKSRSSIYLLELGRFAGGFHKIDSNRWEFANEDFLRGQKHLLKNIHRRKSSQVQPSGHFVGSPVTTGKVGLELEIEKLRRDKNILVQEVLKLQQQQCLTASQMDLMNQRLQAAEQRQKQMLSFLAKVIQNPDFLTHLIHEKERREMSSGRIKRKFLKQQQSNQSYPGSSMGGQIVRYGSDLGYSTPSQVMPELQPSLSAEIPDYLFQDMVSKHDFDASMGRETGNIALDKGKLSIDVAQEPVTALDQIGAGISSLQFPDSPNNLFKGKNFLGSKTDGSSSDTGYFVSFPESSHPEKTCSSTSGLLSQVAESFVKQEEILNMGFNSGVSTHISNSNIWEDLFNYEVQELEGASELYDFLDLQEADDVSQINPWDGGESSRDDLDNQLEHPNDHTKDSDL